jgi:putative oxidoreductase
MSAGIPPFLTVSERPSALPDKSGALQKIRTNLHRSRTSSLEFVLNQLTIARMKTFTIIARILLGLIFVVFGSNAFLHFIPMGPPPQGLAGEYLHVFVASGHVYVIGALQAISGILLLIGRFVPLGLTILAAIIFNIWLFHILVAPANFAPAIVVTILELFLVWRYCDAFKGLLSP